jgi:hypothetical protein
MVVDPKRSKRFDRFQVSAAQWAGPYQIVRNECGKSWWAWPAYRSKRHANNDSTIQPRGSAAELLQGHHNE